MKGHCIGYYKNFIHNLGLCKGFASNSSFFLFFCPQVDYFFLCNMNSFV